MCLQSVGERATVSYLLKEGNDFMALSKLFQLFIQNGKKLLSYLSVLEKGGLLIFLRKDKFAVLVSGGQVGKMENPI